jgi:nucleoside-diphosphate-sugar epimerase
MSIQHVAVLGADGKLGPAVLHALIAEGFQVTVLKRESSKSKDSYPPGVKVTRVPDDFPVEKVAETLRGQDGVVVTIKGNQTEIQERIAQACVQANVKRFIPADFGSCDSSSGRTKALVPLYKRKTELRERLTELAGRNPGFTWTSLVVGHFFDWETEFLHIWVKERRAEILDDGETKWSTSTLSRIGEATAKIFLNLEATKNMMIFAQSFCVSQNQVIQAYERATGTSWNVKQFDSKPYEKQEKAKADDGDLEAVENLVWILGTEDANWETKDTFAMKSLGLQDEDLDDVIKGVVNRYS